jgi:hypothetical protein
MSDTARPHFSSRIAPALTLVAAAPMIAEVLPGATRISSLFVLPIEMGIWGVGALLIRAAVRRWQLGWANMLILAVSLSFAEEFLIQQTSFAPLVIQLVKGGPYARDFGVNWLYLIWAVGYESVLVVFLPVMLVELLYPARRHAVWVSRGGLAVCIALFGVCCFFAWFTWTQIARTKVFHLPAYTPPLDHVIAAVVVIAALLLLALGPARHWIAQWGRSRPSPPPLLLGFISAVIAIVWYAVIVAAFRAWPQVPPQPLAAAALVLAVVATTCFSRCSKTWMDRHRYAVVCGGMIGSMGAGFVGFIGALPMDLYGKAVLDAAAVIGLLALWMRIRQAPSSPADPA